ncbi:putative DNA glycosylase At3g47830 isoform X2 [Aristolochia californica]|uniref:putative DNA glycosylase At3g47830 isoform X2 n=1 Tax=Aristolochia californica TaxID=171875 RepID=UPI0035DAFF6B
MRTNKRRKLHSSNSSKTEDSPSTPNPFPFHHHPTPEECQGVRDSLLAFHGFPQQFAKYQRNPHSSFVSASSSSVPCFVSDQVSAEPPNGETEQLVTSLGGQKESILDGLISTLLSQNTTDSNSSKAFVSFKSAFPTWEDVLAADSKCVENAIRCGGLAATKASCIKTILRSLLAKRGKICLEYLRDMSVNEIKAELCSFKGIGPKTDDFPVDTHVFRIAKGIGWVPVGADREKAYHHLNRRIPNELKFDLNCLLVTHGKACKKCSKEDDAPSNICPVSLYYSSSTN